MDTWVGTLMDLEGKLINILLILVIAYTAIVN